MKKRFTEAQIIGFLREAEAGLPVKDLCRRHGFSEASYYLWVANYYSARNPLRLSSLVILGVVARMFRCATRSSCWCT